MSGPYDDAGGRREGVALVTALRVLRERWMVIVAAVVVCTGLMLVFSLKDDKSYDATARLLFRESELPSLIDPSASGSRDAQRDQGTNLLLIRSTAVAQRVKDQLKTPETPEQLLGQVSVASEADADIINITASDGDPQRAAALANAFAEQFGAYRTDAERARVADAERLLRQQIDTLAPTATAERTELQSALTRVTGLRAITTGDTELVDRATPPTSASSPRPKRDALLGVVLGLVLGVAVAFLVDLLDRRVKTVEDFESQYGLRALTTIAERSWDPSSLRDRQAALEPFRILRNSLGFLAVSSDIRIVMTTSAMPGEGKSTVAAGLARAVALSGQRVILVEADLRRPTFQDQFDLGNDRRGLTTALVGGVPVRELLRPVLPGLRTLHVLPSGPLPPNSSELMRSAEMSEVLHELASEADMVILDAPPLLPVADAQVLLDNPAVDACLIVARTFKTTRDDVRRARAVLERHRLTNLGLVVNGVAERDVGYEYYGTLGHSADEENVPAGS